MFKIDQQTPYRRLTLLMLSGLLWTIGACSTLPLQKKKEKPCANLDWFEIGRQDGLRGEKETNFDKHKVSCVGAADLPDLDLYLGGRNVGLVEFCTPNAGLAAGKTGLPYQGVCPDHLERKFLPAFKVGDRIHVLEGENTIIEGQIQDLFGLLAKTQKSKRDEEILNSRLEELRGRRAKNEEKIIEVENKYFETL